MFALILKALGDSLLSSLFNFIQQEMRDRGLIQQGAEQQHVRDLEATITESKDANAVEEQVARDNDAQLDSALETIRSKK